LDCTHHYYYYCQVNNLYRLDCTHHYYYYCQVGPSVPFRRLAEHRIRIDVEADGSGVQAAPRAEETHTCTCRWPRNPFPSVCLASHQSSSAIGDPRKMALGAQPVRPVLAGSGAQQLTVRRLQLLREGGVHRAAHQNCRARSLCTAAAQLSSPAWR